jgi:hypothetical protein
VDGSRMATMWTGRGRRREPPLDRSRIAMQIGDGGAVASEWRQGRADSEGFSRFCLEFYAGRGFDPLEIDSINVFNSVRVPNGPVLESISIQTKSGDPSGPSLLLVSLNFGHF